ncbi:MAG: MFS transporter [Patescibacteria group bacterium]
MERLQTISIRVRGILSITLLRALSGALLSPIISLYIKQFVDSDVLVSVILTCSYLFGVISLIYGSYIIEKLQKRKTMILSLIAYCVVLLLFASNNSSSGMILFFVIYTFLFTLLQLNISLYIDHFSNKKNIATNFGKNGVLGNIGWIIGPILGGLLAAQFSFIEVFLLSSLFAFLALIIFVFSEPPEHLRHKNLHHHVHIRQNIVGFFKNSFLRRMYINSLGFNIMYGSMFLAPLFFKELGADITLIGFFMGLMAIPWIILELPIGKIADKKHNEKRMFTWGYILLFITLIGFGISKNYYMAFAFLFFTSVATSFIEQTIFPLFYRYVPESAIPISSVFLTHNGFGLFLGVLLPTLALTIMGLGTYYALLGVLMLVFIINSLRLKPQKITANSLVD